MIKFMPVIALLFTAQTTWGASCFPLYEKKADEIQERDGYTKEVGGQLYVHQGQLGYWPGIKVQAKIDNWARELVDAVKWGPYIYTYSSEDPRKDWLEYFRKSIKADCKLPENNYDHLREMLKELMEDGSFCPGDKILEVKLLKGKSEFKKIFKKAVADQRFTHYCGNKEINDDSYRDVKDIDEKKKSSGDNAQSSKQ